MLLIAIIVACGCGDETTPRANFPTDTPAATATVSPTAAATNCELDRFRGCQAIHSQATGHFRTEQIDGRWWLITPEGNVFFQPA